MTAAGSEIKTGKGFLCRIGKQLNECPTAVGGVSNRSRYGAFDLESDAWSLVKMWLRRATNECSAPVRVSKIATGRSGLRVGFSAHPFTSDNTVPGVPIKVSSMAYRYRSSRLAVVLPRQMVQRRAATWLTVNRKSTITGVHI